ncbi:NTP transferase domain-containing protein [Streptacidiphilus sp. 4-A2]|nr:NTP transferase domain-containing protein [Streptacidiphilus sp. 4-A2]
MTTTAAAAGYDAVVLAGGAARRLGGADKPGLPIGGTPLLERVLAGCAGAGTTVVVGPRRPTGRPVRWAREQPPGGGPVAAIAAALPLVTAGTVLLLAADLPFFDAATADRLCAALTGTAPATATAAAADAAQADAAQADAAVLVDAEGREQPLAAAYRTDALRAALALLGRPVRAAAAAAGRRLPTLRLPDPDAVATDCDTWDDVERAQARARARQAD